MRYPKKSPKPGGFGPFPALVTPRAIYRIEANNGNMPESCQKIVDVRMKNAQNRAR
jgi:hypothetical protein